MKRISKTAIVLTAIWSLFVLIGYQGIQGVIAQHAAGYPNAEQIRFYVVFPMAVTVFAALTGLSFWYGRLTILARMVQVLSLVVVFPYLYFYTGGM
jgi:hypothetical protein